MTLNICMIGSMQHDSDVSQDSSKRANDAGTTLLVEAAPQASGLTLLMNEAAVRAIPTNTTNATSSTAREQRRVCFIDEVLGTPQNLVTSIRYRPPTTLEEKVSLYYNSQDYSYFALEHQYSMLVETKMMQSDQQSRRLSWEDCLAYDGDHGHGFQCCDRTADTDVIASLRKVERCHELQVDNNGIW
eukprot:CAMPEP_0183756532 /NCGR_PEP_ID=MMETSP0739-20130205/5101_1 /TAXON_ID=385413 /ORGANISM="Thalassiosira miniscula, Strain CCMP1093" /LENGTH=186 /DNA_ID=CAMNT_0025993753 /DNA_START=276 /DNA_END=833 /DNA_ORIENTATION=+